MEIERIGKEGGNDLSEGRVANTSEPPLPPPSQRPPPPHTPLPHKTGGQPPPHLSATHCLEVDDANSCQGLLIGGILLIVGCEGKDAKFLSLGAIDAVVSPCFQAEGLLIRGVAYRGLTGRKSSKGCLCISVAYRRGGPCPADWGGLGWAPFRGVGHVAAEGTKVRDAASSCN